VIHEAELIRRIHDAWSGAKYSAEIDEALRTWTPQPEEREAQACFLGKDWQQIPQSVLLAQCPAPTLIGRLPMSYYLPAFLLAALATRSAVDSDLMGFLVDFRLRPPKKEDAFARFCWEHSLLSARQREAVADFLRFCRDSCYNSDHEFARRIVRRINDSIERYWGKDVLPAG